jgi:hypothetical protein
VQIEIVSVNPSARLVTFRYGDGPVVGRWRGGGEPHLGPVYVELDVMDVCRWSLDIQIEQQEMPEGIRAGGAREGGCILIGRCEQLAEDDVMILRILGYLVMLETSGEAPTIFEGQLMSVHVPRLDIYPIDL